MFYNRVLQETKNILTSLSFYMMIVILIVMYLTQFEPPNSYNPLAPIPNYQDAETNWIPKSEENEMGCAYKRMLYDLKYGITAKYTTGSVRWTKLTPDQKGALEKAKDKLRGQNISYQDFETLLDTLDKTLKGNTAYSTINRKHIILDVYYGTKNKIPKTYAEALDEFEVIVNKDKVTNAYARLFADYMGITAGFFPVFIVLSVFIRDKKKKGNESQNKRIDLLAKYTAVCLCVLFPYMIIAAHSTYIFYNVGKNYSYVVDTFAFYKYTLLWIGPTILFTVSVSMLLYKIFSKLIITIGIQLVLWGIAVRTLGGDYRLFRYMIRFNDLGAYESYINWKESIIINRMFFVILSFIILGIALSVREHKRIAEIDNLKDNE